MDTHIDAVLFERELRGLRVPVVARIVLGLYVLPLVWAALESGGFTAPWVRPVFFAILCGWLGVNVWFFVLLKRRAHVHAIGLAGAALDIVVVLGQIVPVMLRLPTIDLPRLTMFKMQIPNFGLALIAINALALRPRYPITVAVGVLVSLLGALGLGLADPTSVISGVPADYLAGPAVGGDELNSPLGVIRSGLDTQSRALDKIEALLPDEGRRPLKAARAITASLEAAVDRIRETGPTGRSSTWCLDPETHAWP